MQNPPQPPPFNQQPPPHGFYANPTQPGGSGYPPVPPPRKPTAWQRFRAARKRTQWGIGCVTLFFVFSLCICSTAAVGAAIGPQKTATTTLDATAPAVTTPTDVALIATDVPTDAPTVQSNQPIHPHPSRLPSRRLHPRTHQFQHKHLCQPLFQRNRLLHLHSHRNQHSHPHP